jgi:hypothetical protein
MAPWTGCAAVVVLHDPVPHQGTGLLRGDERWWTNALSRECLWHKTITQLEGLNNRDAGNGSDDGMEDVEAQIQAGIRERLVAEALGTSREGGAGHGAGAAPVLGAEPGKGDIGIYCC